MATATIDESNLVPRISMALNTYRRQKHRMADIVDLMKRIVTGTGGRGGDNSISIIENEEGANRLIAKSTKPLAQ